MGKFISVLQAGNTLAPAIATLKSLGFRVWRESLKESDERPYLFAEKEGIRLGASEPLALLGLLKMVEHRGANWKCTEEEFNNYMNLETVAQPGVQADRP